jgi:hypothetical protein
MRLVPKARVELARPYERLILNQLRLPFRHSGTPRAWSIKPFLRLQLSLGVKCVFSVSAFLQIKIEQQKSGFRRVFATPPPMSKWSLVKNPVRQPSHRAALPVSVTLLHQGVSKLRTKTRRPSVDFKIEKKEAEAKVQLGGVINEDAEIPLQKIATDLSDFAAISFYFGQVKSINSLGVRAWVTFLRSVEDGKQVFFEECVPDVIMQINMIPSFQGKAIIKSFFVNYVSPVTDKTMRVLVKTGDLSPKTLPSPPNCPDSGEPMETEELEEEYFAFLMR